MKIGDLVKCKQHHDSTTTRGFLLHKKDVRELYGVIINIKSIVSHVKRTHFKGQLYTITFSNGKSHVFPENFIELISEA
tara:strand:- start:1950 stop:2186 length:237 start_codon:yes stop_codon:yes gene_type:complete